MALPAPDALRRLASWRPAGGVVSVYAAVEPGDRRGAWRAALSERLKELVGSRREAAERSRAALRATVDRIAARFPEHPPEELAQIGFVEVAESDSKEIWYSLQMPLRRTEVIHAPRPHLRPLVELIDDGSRIGVAAASGDRVRVWEWELGLVSDRSDWEIVTTGDWRERKAQRPRDLSRTGGAKGAGREQHDQRLEAHRERFLHEAGRRAAEQASERGWRELVLFGENEHLRRLVEGLGPREARRVVGKNVVHEDRHRIAERVAELLPELNRARELKLVETVKESAYAGKARGSLGPQETLEALREGRVEHLLFDAERDYGGQDIEEGLAYEGSGELGADEVPVTELMIERALETGARVTPIEGEAAAALDEHGGVAALLRY
jgi:peptide subunit release factor 1 (eRF1)